MGPWTEVRDLAVFCVLDTLPLCVHGVIGALALLAFRGLLEAGIPAKASSAAQL